MTFCRNLNLDFKWTFFKEKEQKTKEQLIYKFLQIFVREFLGTSMLVFWGCACLGEINEGGQTISALMFGIIFGLCMQIFGFDSNCHINPAITLTYFIFGDVSLVIALFYVFIQLLGGVAGYAVLEMIGTEELNLYGLVNINNFCVTRVRRNLGAVRAIFWEAATTGTLCLMVCSIIDPRNRAKLESVPIKFTLCVFCMVYVGTPYTGGSTNPIRSIGPAIWHREFSYHWIYWVGPLIGSLIVSVIYHIFFLAKDEELREQMDSIINTSPVPQQLKKL